MRVFSVILAICLGLLQYRLWISDQGVREVDRLQAAIDAQVIANHREEDRNRQLGAEVNNLKVGLTALEERARSELGMVGSNETFYQIVTPAISEAPAPPATVTARAR
jgi:cell division protein FtsB